MRGKGNTFSRLFRAWVGIVLLAIPQGIVATASYGQIFGHEDRLGTDTVGDMDAEQVVVAPHGVRIPLPLAPGARLPDVPGNEGGFSSPAIARDANLDDLVRVSLDLGRTDAALQVVSNFAARFSPKYTAQLRAEIAHALFIQNDDLGALRVARLALNTGPPGDQPMLGYFVAGLAAYRLGDVPVSHQMFRDGARTKWGSPPIRAATAFWAYRTARMMDRDEDALPWLLAAANEVYTLHGMLARHVLGWNRDAGEAVSQADVDAVAATLHGWRGFAYLQAGKRQLAAAEFGALRVAAAADPVFGRSLRLVSALTGLAEPAPATPLPRLRSVGAFGVNPALVYGVIRVESNFDPNARSSAGALGLMQIMPSTARYLTGDESFDRERLGNGPENLAIGQRYLRFLSTVSDIGDDLIGVLASYNSGPGSFIHWKASMRDMGDALLFLEAVPVAETRAFVRNALFFSWLYAARLGSDAPGLDALARGEFPHFTPAGPERKMVLSAGGTEHGPSGR